MGRPTRLTKRAELAELEAPRSSARLTGGWVKLATMSVDSQLREKLRQALAGMSIVRMALLFGSRARGTARVDSDVDVAVQAPASEGLAIAAVLSAACGREVDVVTLDDPPIPLLDVLIRDGELIFEAERGVGARWRAAALATLELDRPWYERMSRAWLARVAREGLPWSTAP